MRVLVLFDEVTLQVRNKGNYFALSFLLKAIQRAKIMQVEILTMIRLRQNSACHKLYPNLQ